MTLVAVAIFLFYLLFFRPEVAKPAEENLFSELSTAELVRMLELLDMLEAREPINASEREMATLQYLLQSYEN